MGTREGVGAWTTGRWWSVISVRAWEQERWSVRGSHLRGETRARSLGGGVRAWGTVYVLMGELQTFISHWTRGSVATWP